MADARVNKTVLVFECISNGTLRSWILDGNNTKSPNCAQSIRAASVSARKGRSILRVGTVPGMYSNHLNTEKVLLHHFIEKKTWVIEIVVPTPLMEPKLHLYHFGIHSSTSFSTPTIYGFIFFVESFMALLNLYIDDSATALASVQEHEKMVESQE